MHKNVSIPSFFIACLAMVVAASSAQAAAPIKSANASASASSTVFYVPINRAELVTAASDLGEVIVTDPDVADVYVHGKRKISVIGKRIGQTTMRLFDANHKLIRNMDVFVTYDLPAVRRALKEFLPNERVGVSMVNTRIALTGDVSSAASAATAMEIAEEFVRGKLSDDLVGGRRIRDENTQSPVINLMKISSGQQVMLRIRIGEVQRTAIKNLGVSLQAFDNAIPSLTIGTGIGRTAAATGAATAGVFTPGSYNFGTDTFANLSIRSGRSSGVSGALEALERDGLLKVLAEPNLTALSGEEAQFLAGGEFPIAVPQSQGVTTTEYKPFGVALKFTPFVLSQNRIRIQVQPEVSQVSTENSTNVAPSIITRRASTTVELAPGESFMIAGLISDNISSTIDQLPGAGDIPVLGALFRSTAFRRNETELVISVTPYLVDPVKGADVKLPTDDLRPASFMESVFFGALGSNQGIKGSGLEGPTGFMTDN